MHVKNCLDEIRIIRKKLSKLKCTDPNLMMSLEYLEINLKEIKVHGQSMEDRCREYREAIEGLGFTRNKPKKGKNK